MVRIDAGQGIVVDAYGDVLVSGSFGAEGAIAGSPTMTLESGPLTALTLADAFVARLVL